MTSHNEPHEPGGAASTDEVRLADMALPGLMLCDAHAAKVGWDRFSEALAAEDHQATKTHQLACDEFTQLLAHNPAIRPFLEAVFAGSPFLRALAIRHPVQLLRLFRATPASYLAGVSVELRGAVRSAIGGGDDANGGGTDAVMQALRRYKQQLALATALYDLAGLYDLDQVTAALTQGAELALEVALDYLLCDAARRGIYLPQTPDRPGQHSGYFVLAMGKFGGGELNYSSDIDLLVLYEPDQVRFAPGTDIARVYVQLTRDLVRLLDHQTADGYVFRVDLRLRPDPSSTRIALSTPAALAYYESVGQNWERAAFIKARAVAGDLAAADRFMTEIRPFIWRKYLDYAAIRDVHAMKRQIHQHKGHGQIAVAGHNIKLGRGGIREIEFFVQTQQLIYGGRQEPLRGRRTLDMLAELARLGRVSHQAAADLHQAYIFLRMLEHRLQMINDAQTHELPKTDAGLDCVAALAAFADRAALAQVLTRELRVVEHHYAALFEGESALTTPDGQSLVFTGNEIDAETCEALAALGYSAPEQVISNVRKWHAGGYAAMRSEKAREDLTILTPRLLAEFARTVKPDFALNQFDRFLQALPAGIQLFALLRANPHWLELLATIMGRAPGLARILARRPRLFDALLDPGFSGHIPTRAESRAVFQQALTGAQDVQDRFDQMRISGQEQGFLVGVNVLTGKLTGAQAGAAWSAIAGAAVSEIKQIVEHEFAEQHGEIPGGGLAVVAMGKLGSCEMTATSDLDLIMIYDFPDDVRQSDGRKPLTPGLYYRRLTQRLITGLSAQTAQGRLYEVDMRLRPSGNAGPLASHIDGFGSYQRKDAWTWEHMALTRARVIAGPDWLRDRLAGEIADIIRRRRDPGQTAAEVDQMRERIFRQKGSDNIWDLKQVRGGVLDIEFIAQFLQITHGKVLGDLPNRSDSEPVASCISEGRGQGVPLQNTRLCLQKLAAAELLDLSMADTLLAALTLYENLGQILRVCEEPGVSGSARPAGLLRLLLKTAGCDDEAGLEALLATRQRQVHEIYQFVIKNTAVI